MLAALRSVTPARRVGFAIALLGIAGPVGSALGPAGGGWLVDHTSIGLRGLFALDALLSVGAALLLAVAYLEVRPSVAPVGSVMGLARQSLVSIVTSPISLVLFGTFSLVLLGRSVVQPFLPLFVERVHPGADGLPSAIGLVVGSSALIGALLSPAAGALGDRFGYRRILVLVTIITAISLAVLPLAPGIATLALATAFVGGGVSAFTTLVYALLATIVPEDRRSATLNLAFFPVYVGAIIGPFIGALVVEIGLPWVPIVGAGFAAAGLILQRRLPRS